ncbi:MAG: tetratricopeptide repeat protein [Desulfosalsimonadaceae bacterium]
MKLRIALKDILVAPGTPLDSSSFPKSGWIDRIRELYGAIVKVIDVAIVDGFAEIEIPEMTIKQVTASLPTLSRGMDELIKGRYQKALTLFLKVDTIFPGSTDARVNMARVYLKLNDPGKAARYLMFAHQSRRRHQRPDARRNLRAH